MDGQAKEGLSLKVPPDNHQLVDVASQASRCLNFTKTRIGILGWGETLLPHSLLLGGKINDDGIECESAIWWH